MTADVENYDHYYLTSFVTKGGTLVNLSCSSLDLAPILQSLGNL